MYINKQTNILQDADFSPGPFILSLVRNQAADYTPPFYYGNTRILSGLGSRKINPWGFLFPLTPLVWLATLMALFGVFTILQLLSSCMPGCKLDRTGSSVNNAFSSVRVFLQQGKTEWMVLISSRFSENRILAPRNTNSHTFQKQT